MRDRIYISIVDEEGSKQFNLHKVAKKIFLYSLIALLLTIVSGFFLMTYLMKQIRDISATKIQITQNYKDTFYQNQELKTKISSKSQELIDITKRVDDLEEIVNLSKNTDDPIQYNISNLQTTQEQKKILLQIIPNGAPIAISAKIASVKLRPHPSKGTYGINSGIDYIVPLKTPIYATAEGIVDLSRNGKKGYGKFVKLTHAYGFSSMYAHLSEILVKKGDFVQKGQLIGYSGNSGNSNGARLYYEVRFLEGYQNPLDYTQWGEENFDSIFEKQTHVHWDKLLWAIDELRQIKNRLNNKG
ncbi:M23 family metallopeptidase [Helicobacter cholecystus]|uniref:M23 family metallopeptidase n=1 Tax=Helicobacter cholecystus TaxID=45498 RepID=UPI0027389BFC|nr:M23 family metallopeptidase [Helicobacter cholecystus]